MEAKADFDTAAAHKYFAVHCFNACWKLLGQPTRTIEEAEQLIAMGQASLWHWTQRADCAPKNLSIAHWMLSRIYSVLGDAPMAQRYAGSCLRLSGEAGVEELFLGFAYEALARAAMIERDWQTVGEHLKTADEIAERVTDDAERKILADDLKFVRNALTAAQNEHS
jgi:hypothetical protein